MNILYITITPRSSQKMTIDVANELVKNGNQIFIVCPEDAENPCCDHFVKISDIYYLFVPNTYSHGKISLVKKAIKMLTVDSVYKRAIKKAVKDITIDLILYSTPPITLINTIKWVKKYCGAKTYLMLKDIFPQNAVDMGMMKKSGVMGLVYSYFRKKEKAFYHVSDHIGCMSEANIRYVKEHNPEIPDEKLGLCVNSYKEEPMVQIDKAKVCEKYGIPQDKTVFLYGGNLGKPQGLGYFVKILKENKDREDCFFLICGSGNEQDKITNYISEENPTNVKYMGLISPLDFDRLTMACDVGMVFLDHRFTIPNYPSRTLSIMLNGKPVLAATDKNTDIGEMILEADCGWWCESTDTAPMNQFINEICKFPDVAKEKGCNARAYYETHFTSSIACRQILDQISENGGE